MYAMSGCIFLLKENKIKVTTTCFIGLRATRYVIKKLLWYQWMKSAKGGIIDANIIFNYLGSVL